MPTDAQAQTEAWFRNPWVWLMISIPALTVLGCLFTIYLALANPDYIVPDTVGTAASAARETQATGPTKP